MDDAAKSQQETDDNSSKYDDPYEENPVALLRPQNNDNRVAPTSLSSDTDLVVNNRLSEQPLVFDCKLSDSQLCVEAAAPSLEQQLSAVSVSDSAVNTEMIVVPLAVNSEVMLPKEDRPKPMRSYELSAEYGGFFVPSAPTVVPVVNNVQDNDKDEDVGCTDYTDLQPLAGNNTHANTGSCTGSATSGLRHPVTGVGLGGGFYDEPWDLSTTQRGLTEKWRQTKQTKDVGIMAVLDSVADQPSELYAQPQKKVERGHHRLADSSEMRSTGPSYGILCQRVAENGMLAPVSIRDIGTGGCQNGPQHFDLRPVEDYDVPWDQRKSFCKTG